ncbi:MAG TPA: CocE/NonD family hydrolase [Solirubrobacteraceae bacterium]|nr:CocE/NonD family hydrolase [Solirubrobacteraceae bacterium]
MPFLRRCLLTVVIALVLPAAAQATTATVHTWGYLKTRDGTMLRYDLLRPAALAGQRLPVLINYEGYAAGTDATDNGVSTYSDRLMSRGYALLGVSVRGTGCSQGQFDPFDHTMGEDGYDAVEWAAQQPWSNGNVGMIGVSFGGITQLLTAGQQPPHLRAIAASSATSDLYRDVSYPGGILEYDFPFAWTGIQKEGGTEELLTVAAQQGDSQCAANYAQHEAANDTQHLIPKLVLDHPYTSDENYLWEQRKPENAIPHIRVPAMLFNQWQDEQLPARIWDDYSLFPHQGRLWINVSNGNHGRDYYNSRTEQETLDFLDHFVRGVPNSFVSTVPHVAIWMESKIQNASGDENIPSWSINLPSLPHPTPKRLYFGAGGSLTNRSPAGPETGDSYRYPLQSADVLEPGPEENGMSTGQFTFSAPVAPGGYVAYTTPALTRDLVVAGPASLNLWLSSTASDTDLQATVTEVRPDGQEEYIQRGWLRASHRKLNPKRTTVLRPYQTNTRQDARPLVPGRPTYMRMEIFPFAQAFRAGSRIRIYIEAPTGHTGFFAFDPVPNPAINTVLHDRAHPSRLVLGILNGQVAHAPLPACDTLRNQPCRADPLKAGTP